jgi:hypothetical protein
MTDIEIEERARKCRGALFAKLGSVRLLGADVEAIDKLLVAHLRSILAVVGAASDDDDDGGTERRDTPAAIARREEARGQGNEPVLLPIDVLHGSGRIQKAAIAVAPNDLRRDLHATRRKVDEAMTRFSQDLRGAPVTPERVMLRAFVDDGTLDTWFEDYDLWRLGMLNKYEGPQGGGGPGGRY